MFWIFIVGVLVGHLLTEFLNWDGE